MVIFGVLCLLYLCDVNAQQSSEWFNSYQNITTGGCANAHGYVMDNEYYYALAYETESNNGSSWAANQPIWKWNKNTQEWYIIQNITTNNSIGVTMSRIVNVYPYEIDGNHYLSINKYHNDSTTTTGYSSYCYIYKWNKNTLQYDYFNKISSSNAYESKGVWLEGNFYLAIANRVPLYNIDLYKWDHSIQDFFNINSPYQSISLSVQEKVVNNIYFLNVTENNNKSYLIINVYWSHLYQYNSSIYSEVYIWSSQSKLFVKLQDLNTLSFDCVHWYKEDTTYLLTAPSNSSLGYQLSIVWKFDKNTDKFIIHYTMNETSRHVGKIRQYSSLISGEIFITVAISWIDPLNYISQSIIYKWNEQTLQLDQYQIIDTTAAQTLEPLIYYNNSKENFWLFYCSLKNAYNSGFIRTSTFFYWDGISLSSNIQNNDDSTLTIIFIITMIIIGVLLIIVTIYLFYKPGTHDALGLVLYVVAVGDLISDILFIWQLYDKEMKDLLIGSIILFVTVWIFNTMGTCFVAMGWKTQWTDKHLKLLLSLTFCSGDFPSSVSLCSSSLFGLEAFTLNLEEDDTSSLKIFKIGNLIFEDLAQFVIQIIYYVRHKPFNGVTITVTAVKSLSLYWGVIVNIMMYRMEVHRKIAKAISIM